MYRLKLDCITQGKYYAVDADGAPFGIEMAKRGAEAVKGLLLNGENPHRDIKIIRSVYDEKSRALKIEMEVGK